MTKCTVYAGEYLRFRRDKLLTAGVKEYEYVKRKSTQALVCFFVNISESQLLEVDGSQVRKLSHICYQVVSAIKFKTYRYHEHE